MTQSRLASIVVVAMVLGGPRPAFVRAQDTSPPADYAGRWTLDRELSQFPREIGFSADFLSAGGPGTASTSSGGRDRRGGGGGGGGGGNRAFAVPRESQEDAVRVLQLTAEVRNPSVHLTIVDTPAAVTITDDQGKSRTFHPNGKEKELQLSGVTVGVIATREAGRLVVLYQVEQGRELRYTYSHSASPAQLIVDVQFVERGGGDEVKRIYQPTSATETLAAGASPSPVTAKPDAGLPALSTSAQTFNQQPDAELKGLTKLGVVVEDLSPQAAACGLNQGTLETTVSKHLTDAGFTVVRNSDEDTYLYINVNTASVSTGLCVSRYDAFLYTHTTAKLSYQGTPVLVQVSLLHKGGLAGGAPAAHAEGVLRGVQEYVDQFATRIRDANK